MNFIMSGPDWRRLWMHVPGGLLGACLLWLDGAMGITFNFAFLVYEVCQDWGTGGNCGFKDILGHVVGLGIGGGFFLILKLIEIFS